MTQPSGPERKWETVVRTAQPCDHLIQVYQDETFLARAVTQFVAPALCGGTAAVIIATPAHVKLFSHRLADAGLAPRDAVERHQLLFADAESCLSEFMRDGLPDRALFFEAVRRVLGRARTAGYEPTRLYGEMVDLLWESNLPATLALEALWNEALSSERARLLCGYRLDNFDPRVHRGVLHHITRSHSHMIPADDYDRLDTAVARAYDETFGTGEDSGMLRRLMATVAPVETVMPEAQAALFALGRLTPLVADAVLERARRHYATTL